MQVTATNTDGLKHEFKIVVPASAIEERVEGRLQELKGQVSMPGFRPGKVPMTMLRKRFTPSVMGEVLEVLVQDGTSQALNDNNLKPAMQPQIEITSFDEGKDLEFTVAVEVLPTIEEIDYKAISLTRLTAKVEDKEVDEALARIAESRKTNEDTGSKRKAKKGDVLEIDFVGSIDGVEFPGGTGEGYDLELGSNSFIPGFEDQLIGAKPGESVDVKVPFPADYHAKDLAGKDAVFAVTVKALKEAKVPEINEEFATSLGLDTLDALKTMVREQIEKDYASISRTRLKRSLLDALAEAVSFGVPQGMVEMEFQSIWQQIEQAKANDSLDEEDKGKSDEELTTEYRALAERRVRLGLLLAEVGQKNEIKVTQEDLNRAVMQEAMRFPGQAQAVFQYFQNNQEAVNQLRAPLFEDKVVDFLFEMVSVTDKDVPAEELTADPEGDGAASAKKPAAKKSSKKAAKKDESEEG